MGKELILVLGGVRSGKSAFAERLAQAISDKVLYVATAVATDDEMLDRVAMHRKRRAASWQTAELPENVGSSLRHLAGAVDVVLIDCLSLLVSNILFGVPGSRSEVDVVVGDTNRMGDDVWRELDELIESYRDSSATFIVVSNEVGNGVVPPYPAGRLFRDTLGLANQRIAAAADKVYLLVAGVPIELKTLSKFSCRLPKEIKLGWS